MLHPERLITLTIRPADAGAFRFTLAVADEPRIERLLPAGVAQSLHFVADLWRQHLKNPSAPQLAAEAAVTLGVELFNAWLAPDWPRVQSLAAQDPSRPLLLVIATPLLELQLLPWELLLPPASPPLGLTPRWRIRRLPHKDEFSLIRCCVRLRPAPLRVLYQGLAPHDLPAHDPDGTEAVLVAQLARLGRAAVLRVVEEGSWTALAAALGQFQPHLVILCGPALIQGGQGFLAFEEPDGRHDVHAGRELARERLAGSGVEWLWVTGREADHPPPAAALGAVCQALVREGGVPLALAWPDRLADPAPRALLTTLLEELAAGVPVDQALLRARQTLPAGHPAWTLPALYAATTQELLFNPGAPPLPPADPEPPAFLPLLPTLGDAGGLIGRQRLLTRLQHELTANPRLLLHGPAGSGVSAVLAALARATGGWPVGVPATPANPPTGLRLLERLAMTCRERGLLEAYRQLRQGRRPLAERLTLAVALCRQHPLLLLFDGLSPDNCDPALNAFLTQLGRAGPLTSRVLIASDQPLPWPLDSGWRQLPLPPLSQGAALRLWLTDRECQARLAYGEWPPETLERVSRQVSITPGFYGIITAHLNQAPTDRPLPAGNGERLQSLWQTLAAGQQRSLAALAVWSLPIPWAGVAALLGEDGQSALDTAAGLGLLETFPPWPWTPRLPDEGHDTPPEAPPEEAATPRWRLFPWAAAWLCDPARLPVEEARRAQRRAGEYLLGLFEAGREAELGLTWTELAREARHHLLSAGALAEALAAGEPLALAHRRQGDRAGLTAWLAAWPAAAPALTGWNLTTDRPLPAAVHLDLLHAALAMGCPATALGHGLALVEQGQGQPLLLAAGLLLLAQIAREEENPNGALRLALLAAILEQSPNAPPSLPAIADQLAHALGQPAPALILLMEEVWRAYQRDGGLWLVDNLFGLSDSIPEHPLQPMERTPC